MEGDSGASIPRADRATIDEAYYQATLKKPLHEIYGQAEPYLPSGGVAVDLGCGVGTATIFLLSKGLEVFAVDISPRAIEILRSRVGDNAKLHSIVADMAEFEIPSADVISAGFSLFFLTPEDLSVTWPRIKQALRPGGVFIGQFLGFNDEWRNNGHAMVDSKSLGEMLQGLEVLHNEEVERDGETSKGQPKHWHVFHVIARKPV